MAQSKLRPIPTRWLVERIDPAPDEYSLVNCVELFADHWQPGDEYWYYDEPAPPGINAGELGIALVRNGVPIHAVMLGVH